MIREMKKILFKNIKQIFQFEFYFKLLTVLIAIPLFVTLFQWIVKITGYNYLTIENVLSFLLNTKTLILLFLLLILLGFYSLFDIGTIIILLDASKQEKKMPLKKAVALSYQKALHIWKPRNFGFLIFILFLSPFLNLGLGSSVITTIQIPEFIMDFINQKPLLNLVYFLLVLFLLILSLNMIYAIHYYFLEDKTFKESCKSSKKLSSKNHFKDVLKITFMQILLGISYLLFFIFGLFIIALLIKYLNNTLAKSALISLIVGFLFFSLIVLSTINIAVSYTCISVLFYRHKETQNEEIKHIKIEREEKKNLQNKKSILKYALIFFLFLSLTLEIQSIIKGKMNLNIEFIRNIEITAHRGASREYPENTLASFIGAKELGADWIELDVQQTKDEKIIVSHDTNLKRVTNVNKNVWESTYEEIEELDAGLLKDEKFKGEKIPLLESVIEWARENNMKLNIELKPTGKEKNFESSVIDIIKNQNYQQNCVVTSQNYEVLKKVKELDSNIHTVYVMSFAFGNITELEYSDDFSIESSSITKDIVSKIHKEGKRVYGWTVNTEEGINKMIKLNVDNIITDNISLGKELVQKSKTSDLFTEIVKFIQEILK